MRGLVALGAAAILLAGCTSDPQPPATLPPLTSSPTPSPAPVPTPTGINAPDAFGASAFTKHFFEQVNAAYDKRAPTAIRDLSHPDCTACNAFVAEIERLIDERHRYDGGGFIVEFAEAPPPEAGDVVVDVAYEKPALRELNASGELVASYPAKPRVFAQVRLLYGSSWKVRGIREVKPPS